MKKTILAFIAGALVTFSATVFAQTMMFSDVRSTDWFHNDVMSIAGMGVVQGYPDGTYKPSNYVNRAEFAAMLNRYNEHIDMSLVGIYAKLAYSTVDMSEQFRMNNIYLYQQAGLGLSSICDKIAGLRISAEELFKKAQNLAPSVYTQNKIDVFLNEIDSDYANCLGTL